MATKHKKAMTKALTNGAGIGIRDNVVPEPVRERAQNGKSKAIISPKYPYKTKMKRADYEAQKRKLQVELLKLQRWVQEEGERIVLLFEGRDAAGKGGTIKRFMEHLNPRSARVVALAKPTTKEQGQWYFQRYINHLPTRGELVFFDRSWYNRAVVEPVMGFCTQSQHHAFLRQVPLLENMLIEDGIRLFKFWFSVSREEQYRRFKSRESDSLKQWKLSPVDTKGLSMWHEYTEAKKSMFMATDTMFSPWTVIRSDDKKRARLACMRYVLSQLPYANKDVKVASCPDPKILGRKEDIYEDDEW
jgi:polyphosphate kinase 2